MEDNRVVCKKCDFVWHSNLLANKGILPKECTNCKSRNSVIKLSESNHANHGPGYPLSQAHENLNNIEHKEVDNNGNIG